MSDLKQQRRRYYLHRKVKEFTRIDVASKTIDVHVGYQFIKGKKQFYLQELINLGYVLQLTIPD